MKFFTLSINPPEEIKPILVKRISQFGYDDDYFVINLDPKVSTLNCLMMAIESTGATHWNYIEDEGNE